MRRPEPRIPVRAAGLPVPCPVCSSPTRVKFTRVYRRTVTRWRVCDECPRRFVTVEERREK